MLNKFKLLIYKYKSHARRLSFHLGRRINTGTQSFIMRGYYASRLDHDSEHEPYMVDIFRKCIAKKDGVFIDVGVNIGQTLLKILEINPNQPYIGFEPQVGCCFHVEEFIRLNRLENATVIPVALSDQNGTLKFYSRHQFDDLASLNSVNEERQARGEILTTSFVQARVGDEIFKELNIDQISAIKIDVEGTEIDVLKGLSETLKLKMPALIFEVLPNYFWRGKHIKLSPEETEKHQSSADEIFHYLTKLGYDIFQLDSRGEETKIDYFELNNREVFVGFNYIALPK